MDRVDKSKTSILIFIGIILIISVGGYFLIHQNKEKKEKESTTPTYEEIKIDKEQDFVYYTDLDVISSELEIIYKKVNININSNQAKQIEKEINAKTPNLKNSIKYISQETMPEDKAPLYFIDDIYSASIMEIHHHNHKNKLVLQTKEYTYDCFGSGGAHLVTSYVFDLNDGSIIKEEKLLKEYSITKEQVKEIVSTRLTKIKNDVLNSTGTDIIDYDATMSNFDNDQYSIYIGKNGDLIVNLVVITTEINYNEDIVIS